MGGVLSKSKTATAESKNPENSTKEQNTTPLDSTKKPELEEEKANNSKNSEQETSTELDDSANPTKKTEKKPSSSTKDSKKTEPKKDSMKKSEKNGREILSQVSGIIRNILACELICRNNCIIYFEIKISDSLR